MSGRPTRAQAKSILQARISADIYRDAQTLRSNSWNLFSSFSHMLETLVFWVEGIYVEGVDQDVLRILYHIKAQRLADFPDVMKPSQRHNLRATIDPEALTFLNMLCARYRTLFESRAELIELILLYAKSLCVDQMHTDYLMQRLQQVVENHPQRY